MKKFTVITLLAIVFFSTQASAINTDTETALMYLGQPQFSGGDFLKQLTGCNIAELELVSFRDEAVYFSADAEKYSPSEIKSRCTAFEKIEFGKTRYTSKLKIQKYEDGGIIVGTKVYSVYGRYFFRVPFESLQFNNRLTYSFGKGVYYDITLAELRTFADGVNSYDGAINFITSVDYHAGVMHTLTNHGLWLSRKEPSLTRLAKRITRNCHSNTEKVQALTDFVSNEIAYSFSEANASVETMKESNEILMSGEADCSGKTTLLISLLEQLDLNCILIYMKNHVTVGVEWPTSMISNKLCVSWRGSSYTIAEATTRGFEVGRSIPQKSNGDTLSSKDTQYIQAPGGDIYTYLSMRKLEYVEK